MDVPDHDLAARSQQGLRRQPVRAQTTDGGQSWTIISPDLTPNDKTQAGESRAASRRTTIGVEYAGVVFAIAESPLEKGLIWAGTNDGQVHVTRDGGDDLDERDGATSRACRRWGTVSNIEPSRYDAGTAYLTVDLHQVNNRDPFVYKTTDYGKTWKTISGDIPKSVLSATRTASAKTRSARGCCTSAPRTGSTCRSTTARTGCRCRPTCRTRRSTGSPIQDHFNDLVVGTYGRGFWILDDITPLRQLAPQTTAKAAQLLAAAAGVPLPDVEAPFRRDVRRGRGLQT